MFVCLSEATYGQYSIKLSLALWPTPTGASIKSEDQVKLKATSCKNLDGTITKITRLSAGLKVNDQLVAYATRFLAVRLKKYVWSHHHALKAKV